ncbi:hypothetical protein PVK06_001764 [Gossypium arboreum]|uniref:Zinc knuckle CX2CX4HX4C domain-containing protein n=1 Tax=Gossypium arboreum TaxID=29729 RepID=A0ABR0R379_GOSAR|nr:hypothetical protein PVK06_001764 [Gossypium arboreum]
MDIRKLIKRRKKLIIGNGKEHFVSFKYEKLTTFCFLYGKLGHGESFCPIQIIHEKELPLGWNISLKVTLHRAATSGNIWLRDSSRNWGVNFGNNVKGNGRILRDNSIPNLMRVMGANLGINLVSKSNYDLEGNLADMVNMDSLEEERHILSTDGKKRPRTSYVSQVSYQ